MGKCAIYYYTLTDEMRKEEKLQWLNENRIKDIPFIHIQPDKNHNWIDLTDNDWDEMIPLANKETKLSKNKNDETAVFKLFSLGVVTARDEWVYDYDKKILEDKVKYLIDVYNIDVDKLKNMEKSKIKDNVDYQIKWSRAVKNDLFNNKSYSFNNENIIYSIYRPFIKKYLYFNKQLNEMQYQLNKLFIKKENYNNLSIVTTFHDQTGTAIQSTDLLFDYGYGQRDSTCYSLYRFTENEKIIENITDWGLKQFRNQYQDKKISKEEIFNYVYAVLHNPEYRKKYEMNLKRELPRIPFYKDFRKWVEWGKKLMDLHINFETVKPYKLKRIDDVQFDKSKNPNARIPKAKLHADKDSGIITLDEQTILTGIPASAWEYKLGNRSALEWILDQYKEKKPKDPTIREKFNTYRFADYKEKVIALILCVTTVSVETMKIIEEMGKT